MRAGLSKERHGLRILGERKGADREGSAGEEETAGDTGIAESDYCTGLSYGLVYCHFMLLPKMTLDRN